MQLTARCEIFASFGYGQYCPEVWKKMKELGCAGVDYPLGGGESEEKLTRVKQELADAGLYVHQVHGPFPYPTHDELPEFRARLIESMKNSIRKTAFLGAKEWIIHPFFPFGQTNYLPDEVIRINEECFRQVIPTAKECGVTICFENMPYKDFPIASPAQILDFVHRMDDENFKFCLDTGHSNVLGTPPAEAVRMAGSDLRALHVHDNDGKDDRHCMPYTGNVDWNDFMKALREVDYKGTLSLECNFLDPLGQLLPGAPDEVKFNFMSVIVNGLLSEK